MSGSTILAFMALAGAGTALRWMATDNWPEGHRGTLLVNVIGAFLLGLLAGSWRFLRRRFSAAQVCS